jgi:hypothetical protein
MTEVRTKLRGGRVRKGTKILEAQDRGRLVLKVVLRFPMSVDDADARLYAAIVERNLGTQVPSGTHMEMTLRRHADKTGNLLEGEAAAKRYSKANKSKVEEEEVMGRAHREKEKIANG